MGISALGRTKDEGFKVWGGVVIKDEGLEVKRWTSRSCVVVSWVFEMISF